MIYLIFFLLSIHPTGLVSALNYRSIIGSFHCFSVSDPLHRRILDIGHGLSGPPFSDRISYIYPLRLSLNWAGVAASSARDWGTLGLNIHYTPSYITHISPRFSQPTQLTCVGHSGGMDGFKGALRTSLSGLSWLGTKDDAPPVREGEGGFVWLLRDPTQHVAISSLHNLGESGVVWRGVWEGGVWHTHQDE